MNSGVINVSSKVRNVSIYVENGKITEETIRHAFLLDKHIPFNFSQVISDSVVVLPSKNSVFSLINGWQSSGFNVEWEEPHPLALDADDWVIRHCRKFMLYSLITQTANGYANGTIPCCVTVANSKFAVMAGHALPLNFPVDSNFEIFDFNKQIYKVKLRHLDQINYDIEHFAA